MVGGEVAPGFEPVRDVFIDNFESRGEVGAACCVFLDGARVVDLWGGWRDVKACAPWEENTIVPVFSTTKGMSAMALALANSRGYLDYDEKVSSYWPEFAQSGKAGITVRQLLAHQAGICVIDAPLHLRTLYDLDAVAVAVAKQGPEWEPGTRCGYHALSLGWYEQELLRRVDPRGRSLGRFFADEIARPLGVDFFIGLPPEIPGSRIARLRSSGPLQALKGVDREVLRMSLSFLAPGSLMRRSVFNPMLRPSYLNRREYLSVEMPAANGIGEARAIARLYGVFATGGQELGIRPETVAELYAPAAPPTGGMRDLVLQADFLYSLGFMKHNPPVPFGTTARAFGMPGMGGSIGFADPDARVGFAYTPNMLSLWAHDDPRARALRESFYGCL